MRITGQLIDAATGSHIWADRFDGDVADIFQLQDQVTERVVGAIAPAIERAEIERARLKPTESLDAYSLYLRGLSKFYKFSGQANAEALRLFKIAIDVDPDFAAAYGRAALCYVSAKAFGWSSDLSSEVVEVKRFSQRAVGLGKDDAMALSLSAWALAYGAGDLQSGSSLIDRALAMNSNLADSWHYGGWIKNWLGEREIAIERFAHAIRLSPLDPLIAIAKAGAAHCHFYLGRYDEAMSWAALAFQDDANNQAVLRIVAASNALAGRTDEAREAVALLCEVNPTLRLSNLKEVLGPYRQEDLLLYQEAMRRAGLPE